MKMASLLPRFEKKKHIRLGLWWLLLKMVSLLPRFEKKKTYQAWTLMAWWCNAPAHSQRKIAASLSLASFSTLVLVLGDSTRTRTVCIASTGDLLYLAVARTQIPLYYSYSLPMCGYSQVPTNIRQTNSQVWILLLLDCSSFSLRKLSSSVSEFVQFLKYSLRKLI